MSFAPVIRSLAVATTPIPNRADARTNRGAHGGSAPEPKGTNMTITRNESKLTDREQVRATLPTAALVTILGSAVLVAFGIWGDGSPSEDPQIRVFLVVCGFIAMAAAVVFGWLVPRGLRNETSGGLALTLSILGLVTVLAFWAGVTPVLAVGGILLGWAGRRMSGVCKTAVAVGALALVADVGIYVMDWMSTNGII
jgi:hypothetical protein